MKKILITILISASMLAVLEGCKKLLDAKQESSITEEVYFKNESDFEPNLAGIYTYMRGFANSDAYGEQRSEELVNGANARLGSLWLQTIDKNTNTLDYNGWYTAIGHCNLLLDKIQGFAFASNPDTKKRIIAETLALRAYFYFHLTRIIGRTPLMLQAIVNDNVPLLPRSSTADVMKQIQKDIDDALVQLQSMSNFSKTAFPSTKYRFSYAAIQSLKADAKLWSAKVLGGGNADLDAAIAATSEVEASGVSLNANFKDVVGLRAPSNPEIILSAYFQRDEITTNYAINAAAISNQIPTTCLNRDSIGVTNDVGLAQGGYFISPKSKALFSYTNDKRPPFTFLVERYATGYGTNSWIVKYPGNKYSNDRYPDNDIIMYRLADVYLMKAEAYAAKNDLPNAKTYLDYVRNRAGIGSYTITDKQSMEKEILDERGRELYFENKRWFDLVRFHKGGTIDIYTYVPNLAGKTTPLFWPLSSTVLSKNSLLDQTEGY